MVSQSVNGVLVWQAAFRLGLARRVPSKAGDVVETPGRLGYTAGTLEVVLMKLHYGVFPTDFGWYAAIVSDRGLRYASMTPTALESVEALGPRLRGAALDDEAVAGVRDRIEGFFAGDARALEGIPLDLEGAPAFHREAWEACRSIPPGETRSYAWLAAEAGRPRAYRAAGQAMARNRVPVVVPCHRVIGSNGGLHGYGAGGLDVKERLLNAEASMVAALG